MQRFGRRPSGRANDSVPYPWRTIAAAALERPGRDVGGHSCRGALLLEGSLAPQPRALRRMVAAPGQSPQPTTAAPPDRERQQDACRGFDFLAGPQREICSSRRGVMPAVGVGMKTALEECQFQFRMSRWNCSTVPGSGTLFGNVMTIKSREKAFVYAISAAGVAYSVTRACARGDLNECNCDSRVRQRKAKSWQWGGCSEDIHHGEAFSREFVDSVENRETGEGLMNIHNNEAGRRSIRSRMERVCKCHGMSGSCSMRVCWRKLPPFRRVGDALAARYEGASHVRLARSGRRRPGKKLRAVSRDLKKPNKTDLVYLEDSPDYCERNDTMGILGTRGRICNRTSMGLDGCRLLCCGRGYQTRVRDVEEKCNCRFVWCCNVVCEMCRYKKEEHICN
ncbi:protein Wnt-1-like [Schistocerca cancellata]|uniref:protein Wnt-1-like n=1 Tax=Schistocerca cancellata TaxID=274614 RepID=UPI00211831DD|nr:protein Wnt-1-like [Schistocerca cancellata]